MEPQHRHKSTTHKEMYAHFHPAPTGRWQGGTVFARKEDDGHWYCSAALCLQGDQFCKRIGRTIARRKYMNTNTGGIGSPLHTGGLQLVAEGETPTYDELRQVFISYCLGATR